MKRLFLNLGCMLALISMPPMVLGQPASSKKASARKPAAKKGHSRRPAQKASNTHKPRTTKSTATAKSGSAKAFSKAATSKPLNGSVKTGSSPKGSNSSAKAIAKKAKVLPASKPLNGSARANFSPKTASLASFSSTKGQPSTKPLTGSQKSFSPKGSISLAKYSAPTHGQPSLASYSMPASKPQNGSLAKFNPKVSGTPVKSLASAKIPAASSAKIVSTAKSRPISKPSNGSAHADISSNSANGANNASAKLQPGMDSDSAAYLAMNQKMDPQTTQQHINTFRNGGGPDEKEVGRPSGMAPRRPVPAATSTDILSGQRAIDVLRRAGLIQRSRRGNGTWGYRPAPGFDNLGGSPVPFRTGEERDPGTNQITRTQDSQITSISGIGYDLGKDGFLKGDVAIVVDKTPPDDKWQPWITPQQAATNLLASQGDVIPPGRRGQVDPARIQSLDDGPFRQQYIDNHGSLDGEEDTAAFVDRRTSGQPTTIINENKEDGGTVQHEMTHLASNPDFRRDVGHEFNEAVTEYFTQEFTRSAGVERSMNLYGADGRLGVIRDMVKLVGRDNLRRAYFGTAADLSNLRRAVDRARGPGTFDAVTTMTNAGRYDLARLGLQ